MRVLITRTTIADGRVVRAGAVEDLSERDATLLLQLGKAEIATDSPVIDPQPEPKRKARKRAAD